MQNKVSHAKKVIRTLRRALNYKGLNEKDTPQDPFVFFDQWINQAISKESFEPNAMTLATASKEGKPSARTVLLKDYGPQGFIFYTNYESRKGDDLSANPQASLVFYWGSLSRQVLIDGKVEKVKREDSIAYFHSRPRSSQIAAYVSAQSHAVPDRNFLEDRMKAAAKEFKNTAIPCPIHWGGYRLKPDRIEFWQGRTDRLHDRLCYTHQSNGSWRRERLAP